MYVNFRSFNNLLGAACGLLKSRLNKLYFLDSYYSRFLKKNAVARMFLPKKVALKENLGNKLIWVDKMRPSCHSETPLSLESIWP